MKEIRKFLDTGESVSYTYSNLMFPWDVCSVTAIFNTPSLIRLEVKLTTDTLLSLVNSCSGVENTIAIVMGIVVEMGTGTASIVS